MTIANQIRQRIEQFEPGEVFTIQDFSISPENQPALVRFLNRRVMQGELTRLSKGRYFKPRNTRFGQLSPGVEEIVKDLLVKNGKRTGYISGTPVFVNLGITTQISSNILIGSSVYRRPTERLNYKINFHLQRNPITESTIPMLQLLDAVKYFREIPANTPDEAISKISDIFKARTKDEIKTLSELALSYPNYVRALVGAIMENIGQPFDALKLSLNGVTTYKLKISEKILPTKKNWNIL